MGIVIGLLAADRIPEMQFANLNPKGTPVFPFMFVTVACGAVSGFHGTRPPMTARCIKSEKHGRRVFYGAMIIESVIVLVWADAAYLVKNAKRRWYSLMCALPAVFMTTVCTSYILMTDEGFKISSAAAYPIGICVAAVCAVLFTVKSVKAVRDAL